MTNSDGRTDAPLIGGRPVPIGRYELTLPHRQLLRGARRAAVRSAVPRHHLAAVRGRLSPEGHLHVPLLVTPWSFATYRGS